MKKRSLIENGFFGVFFFFFDATRLRAESCRGFDFLRGLETISFALSYEL